MRNEIYAVEIWIVIPTKLIASLREYMVEILKSSCKSRIYHVQFSFKRHNVASVESDPTLFLSNKVVTR